MAFTTLPVSTALCRHVTALVSDMVAEYGEVDLVGRRLECHSEAYDGLIDSFEAFGVVGGAGIRIVRDDRILLVRYENAAGWIEPGAGRQPGESYLECAKRGLREATGLEASIEGLAQLHLVYLDDPSGHPPVPNPYLSFTGSIVSGETTLGESAIDLQWADELPYELAYDELAELRFG